MLTPATLHPTRSVLFISRKWPPAVGGMETYCVELTRVLASMLPVRVIALPGRQNGAPPQLTALIRFAFSTARAYLTLPEPPRVLHISDLASWPFALLAVMRRPRPIVVISIHGTDVSFHRRKSLKGRLYGAYLRLGAKLLPHARLLANSFATASAASETGWLTSKVIPLATNVDAPAPVDSHDGNLLFVGRLIERKGCLWFVRNVLPLLPEAVGLKVAGPLWDEKEGDALRHPRVTYLGSLSPDELREEYRKALCVVVPNIDPPSGEFEGFGLVAADAAAAGGLVLAAGTGGLLQAIVDGKTGFLVPAGNAKAWATKINEIASWSNDYRADFLIGAWKSARIAFSWRRVAEETTDFYRDSLA